MGRYIIVLLTICIFPFSSRVQAQEKEQQQPSSTITFDERVHDFGTILEAKGKVTHVFTFHNHGAKPAVISDVASGCGCIGKAVSKEPVKPGGTGKVTITFNPEYKSGFFSKEIVVLSNGGQEYNRIWVQGHITPGQHPVKDDYPYDFGQGLFLRLKVIAFGYLKQGEMRQMELQYANNTNKEMTLGFLVQGNKTGLVFTNPGKIAPQARGVMTFSYTMPALMKDDVFFSLYPVVNNKKLTETLDIRILNDNKLKQQPISKPNH